MKPRFLPLLPVLTLSSAIAGLPFAHQHEISPGEPLDSIVAKAAHTVPTARQLAWHHHEFIAFIHFGPNTFTGREWGNGMEDPAVFAPEQVDTDNWCRHLKAAGMKMVVMTFKHHDGYCLWQTRYEPHQSLRKSPYQNGKGDIAKQLSQSCAKFGLKFGVYLSPADLYQIESRDGLYGNLSKGRKSAIPTDPASFRTDPSAVRPGLPADAPTFEYVCDDYNRYMLNQLYEMLTEYGPVHEVWFDGAHPKRKGGQRYTYAAWYDLIRHLAPDACIFGKGPDIRWCGNEAGRTRPSEWNIVPLQVDPATHDWPDNTPADIGSRSKLAKAKFLYYRPAETNTSIRHGWFWRNDTEQSVRSPDDVFDIYERAVGGNSVFMLNVPPNTAGVFSKRDADCLIEVGKRITATYGIDLARNARISAPHLQDGDLATFWSPRDLASEALTITLPAPTAVNRVMFQEALGVRGQRIEHHALDAWVDGRWTEVATGTTVGYKKILRFPTVTTERLRLRITQSRLAPTVAEISVHYHDQPPLPVTISRGRDGKVRIALKQPGFHGKGAGFAVAGQDIHFTLDGSEPTTASPRFTLPIDLPDGGEVRARSVGGSKPGPVARERFGISTAGWKATATSEENAKYGAAMAIDGDPGTFWHSRWSGTPPAHPHTLTIDLGSPRRLGGFSYLPRQDRRVPDSMVEAWRAEGSLDGRSWVVLAEGEFGNLVNDPARRHAVFTKPARIRFFRFISLRGAGGKPYAGAAEIELTPASR
jgi:alpha-L-fucosidase